MTNSNTILELLKNAAISTIYQMVLIFGVFFVAGLVLYLLARFTRNSFARSGNHKLDIFLTGWLGTPVHELGHAFFCLVFLHRIDKIRLFNFNPVDGSLGYVHHSYNRNNLYQLIGNLFIGAGPVIFGAGVLYAVMIFLLPNPESITTVISSSDLHFGNIMNLSHQWESIVNAGKEIITSVFHAGNFDNISFWIFIYLSLAISSHMELSPADLRSMLSGLGIVAIVLFIVNFIALIFGYDISEIVLRINAYTGILFGLFLYAIIISSINFLVSYFLLAVYTFLRYKRLINPFF